MTPELAIGLSLCLPTAGALGVALTGRWPNLREGVTVLFTLLTFGAVLTLVPEVTAGGRPGLEVLEVVPGLVLAFEVEPLGLLYGMVAAGLWIVTSIYAFGYMRGHAEKNQTRFYVFFAVAITAAQGIAYARNLFTLFLFYELLTLSTFPLVTHHGDEKAKRAGRTYLGILISTSVLFLLLGIVWTWQLCGTLEFAPGGILAGHADGKAVAILLALYAFGTGKAALMPFHRWLPAAMVAPTPVSALLHAVAVVKAGVFTVLKVVVYVFGIDLLQTTGASLWLMYAAAFTLVVASVIAITKDNLKARLAYSTISQLSYIVLGAALATASGVIGGGMHIAMHAVGKITLFFCAGAIMVAAHKTEVSEMDGLGRKMPVTMFAFLLGSISIIGLPPFGGSWSKWHLALGALEADQIGFVAVLMISSLLSIAYLMPVVGRAFFLPPRDEEEHGDDHGHDHDQDEHPEPHDPGDAAISNVFAIGSLREAPLLCLVPLSLTAVGALVMFFTAGWLYALLEPIAGGGG